MTKQSQVLLVLTLVACGSTESEITPENTLMISTLSAEEEGMIDQEQAQNDEGPVPEMFRTCDRRAFFDALSVSNPTEESDSGWLEDLSDAFSKQKRKKGKKGKAAKKMLTRLLYIYDVDEDGVFSESEKTEIFSDFDARCEVLHEKLLSDFDTDEDGELSEDEKALAKETIQDLKASHKEAHTCNKDLNAEDRPNLPKFAQEFDLDGDDELSETELQTLRDVLRERIRNGEAWNRSQQDDLETEETEETVDAGTTEGEQEETESLE